MTLDNVPLMQTVEVVSLNPNWVLSRRLLDLGLISGTKVTPIFVSPSGDPTAFEFRGSVIAIRIEDCREITVK